MKLHIDFFKTNCLILDLQLFHHLIMKDTKIAACSWVQPRQRRSGPTSKMNSLSFQNGQMNMELWLLSPGDSQKGATRSFWDESFGLASFRPVRCTFLAHASFSTDKLL